MKRAQIIVITLATGHARGDFRDLFIKLDNLIPDFLDTGSGLGLYVDFLFDRNGPFLEADGLLLDMQVDDWIFRT